MSLSPVTTSKIILPCAAENLTPILRAAGLIYQLLLNYCLLSLLSLKNVRMRKLVVNGFPSDLNQSAKRNKKFPCCLHLFNRGKRASCTRVFGNFLGLGQVLLSTELSMMSKLEAGRNRLPRTLDRTSKRMNW